MAFYWPMVLSISGPVFLLFALVILALPIVSKQFFQRAAFGITSTLLFFLLGIFLVGIQANRWHADYFANAINDKNDLFQIEVIEVPEEKENSVKCFANVTAVNGQKTIGKTLIYLEKTDRSLTLRYGDVLCLKGNFSDVRPNGNPMEFDYSRYLRIHNVTHQSYVRDTEWEKVTHFGNAFFTWIYGVREYLGGVLDKSGMNGSNLMVARALILGEKASLDRETLRTFSSAGAMHVLAVSGLHVGIVMLIFSFLLKPVKRLPNGRILFIVLVVICIWFYALITGMSSSVLRAAVMFSFVIIGKELERESSVYQSIMVSAFLLVLIEPLIIFQVGFQLSYLAVLGIVFLQPKIYNLFYTKYFLLDKVWQISSVSIAAQLATFPLGLYYFHQFPNFFMLSNLIVIPLAFAILIAGIVYFTFFWIPGIGYACFLLVDGLLTILNAGVRWVEQLPHSIYWGVSIHWFEVFCLYLIIVLGAISFINRKAKWLIISLSLSVLLLVFNVAEKQYINATNQLVIYNVNKATAVDLFYGGKNVFIADQKLIEDDDKLLFHVKHNWFYRSGNEYAYKTVQLNDSLQLLSFQNKTLFRMDSTVKDKIPKTDFVLLENIAYLDSRVVADFANRNVSIVLGQGIAYRLKYFIEDRILPRNLHDLKAKGAFIVNF
ncbi:MAG: competence protein ComEC [Crocinitomix sp.]|jgi:competence protein ComEC